MSPSQTVDRLLHAALDDFDRPGRTVSSAARQALRIAALRHDYVNQLWLQWELTDVSVLRQHKTQDPVIAKLQAQLQALLGADEGRRQGYYAFQKYERTRTFSKSGEEVLIGHSLGQVEQNLRMQHLVYDDLQVPDNLTQIDTYHVSRDIESGKAKMLPGLHQDSQLLERARSAIHSFLVATECELDEGQRVAPLFNRAQDYINAALANHAPDALAKFVVAQERLYSGNPEDLAHALTSCRRMLKALADELYPATDEVVKGADGIDRTMSDDVYRNRLLQYVREKLGKHKQGPVVQRTLDSLGARLASLDSLASKGVHADVSGSEAETCIVWTYLLAGDILRIADGSSVMLTDSETEPS